MNLELNKIAAAVLLAGLLAMLAGTFANVFYHVPELEKRGYSVEVPEEGGAIAAPAEEEINLPLLLSKANAEAGKKVAKKCLACHTFDKGGANKVGPNLWGIIGEKYAHNADFGYSKAFKELQGGWDYDNLFEFLSKPKKYVPGTKMAFAGLRKPEDVANLLAYLRVQADAPYPLPEIAPDAAGDLAPEAGGIVPQDAEGVLDATATEVVAPDTPSEANPSP